MNKKHEKLLNVLDAIGHLKKLLNVLDTIGHLKNLSSEDQSKFVNSIDGKYNPHILRILKRYALIGSDDRFAFLGTVQDQIERLSKLRDKLDAAWNKISPISSSAQKPLTW